MSKQPRWHSRAIGTFEFDEILRLVVTSAFLLSYKIGPQNSEQNYLRKRPGAEMKNTRRRFGRDLVVEVGRRATEGTVV